MGSFLLTFPGLLGRVIVNKRVVCRLSSTSGSWRKLWLTTGWASRAAMKWAESEIHPNPICRTKSEASWLLRDSPWPIGQEHAPEISFHGVSHRRFNADAGGAASEDQVLYSHSFSATLSR